MSLVADHLNVGFLGVAAAAVSAQFLGWFWYSDKAFGKSYCKELERCGFTNFLFAHFHSEDLPNFW